jgi:hypothetical protein
MSVESPTSQASVKRSSTSHGLAPDIVDARDEIMRLTQNPRYLEIEEFYRDRELADEHQDIQLRYQGIVQGVAGADATTLAKEFIGTVRADYAHLLGLCDSKHELPESPDELPVEAQDSSSVLGDSGES